MHSRDRGRKPSRAPRGALLHLLAGRGPKPADSVSVTPDPSPPITPAPRSRAREALIEAIRIAIVGACVAVSLGVLRGVPSIESLRADDPATCGSPVARNPEIAWIDQGDARDLVTDVEVTFVDARPRAVYEAGHVAGAINVPIDTGAIDDRATQLVRGARVVITYCDTGGDCAASKRLAGLLAEAGLSDVRVLRGGMPEWLANDYPSESGPCRMCP